jgi:hypothetical protein
VFCVGPHTLATAFTSFLAVATLLVLVPYAIRVSCKGFIEIMMRTFGKTGSGIAKIGFVLFALPEMST